MHGQGQNCEQNQTTKNLVGFRTVSVYKIRFQLIFFIHLQRVNTRWQELYLSHLRMTSRVDMYTALWTSTKRKLKFASGLLDFTNHDTDYKFSIYSKIKHADKIEVLYYQNLMRLRVYFWYSWITQQQSTGSCQWHLRVLIPWCITELSGWPRWELRRLLVSETGEIVYFWLMCAIDFPSCKCTR